MKTRAAILHETGRPLVVVDDLEVCPPEDGQVLVKVAYSGVCRSQLMEVCGGRGEDPYLPHLLGHEGSGVVIGIGPGVSKVAAGDRVVLTWIKGTGADAAGGRYARDGSTVNAGPIVTFAQHVVVSENRCVKLPDGVPMDVAALLGCAVPTGAGVVFSRMQPKRTSSMAVFGLGGVGLSALMAAAIHGCSPIVAVDVDDNKLSLARELGATTVVNARKADPIEVIRSVADGGVDFAVEAAGRASTIQQAFECVRDHGGLCVFTSHPPEQERICLEPHAFHRGKKIEGSWGGGTDPDRDIPMYAVKYGEGVLPLEKLISHRFSLENVNEALDALESGKALRVLLEMEV